MTESARWRGGSRRSRYPDSLVDVPTGGRREGVGEERRVREGRGAAPRPLNRLPTRRRERARSGPPPQAAKQAKEAAAAKKREAAKAAEAKKVEAAAKAAEAKSAADAKKQATADAAAQKKKDAAAAASATVRKSNFRSPHAGIPPPRDSRRDGLRR